MSEPLDYATTRSGVPWKSLRLSSMALAVAAVPMVLAGLVGRRVFIASLPPGRDMDDVGREPGWVLALIVFPFLMTMAGGAIGLVAAIGEKRRGTRWGVVSNLVAFALCTLLALALLN